MDNILIKKKIRELLKKKNIKANKSIIKKIDEYSKKSVQNLLNVASYQLQLEGKKVLSDKSLNEAIQRLKKEEKLFEI